MTAERGGRTGAAKGDTSKRSGARNARRRAREFALQGIYEWLISGNDLAVIESNLTASPGFEKCDKAHCGGLVSGIVRDYEGLWAKLDPYLDRPAKQISPVERAVLLIGVYELQHHAEIPYRVVINEAIDLTKSFGGTDGHRFVNGILDRVAIDFGVNKGLR